MDGEDIGEGVGWDEDDTAVIIADEG